MYTYIGTYTYIYTHSPSLDTLCPIRLSLRPCWLFPPRGPFHFHFFIFFKNPKTKLKSFRISRPSRNMLQNDGDFTRTEKGRPLFFSTGALGRAFLVKLPFYPPFRDPAQEPCPLPASKLALSPRPGQEGVYPLAGWVNPPS